MVIYIYAHTYIYIYIYIPLRIFSVNVTKSEEAADIFTEETFNGKLDFFVQWYIQENTILHKKEPISRFFTPFGDVFRGY